MISEQNSEPRKNMFSIIKTIYDDVFENPTKHLLLIGSGVSLVIGLCAWQYCRAYFKTLGIVVSYAHIDNLIFVFEQIVTVSILNEKTSFLKKPSSILYIFPIFLGCIYVVKYFKPKLLSFLKGLPRIGLLNSFDYKLGGAMLFMYVLIIACSFILGFGVQSWLSALFIFLGVGLSLIILVREILSKSLQQKFYKPILGLIIVLFPFNLFYMIGRSDAQRILNDDLRNLDTACLAKPSDEFDRTTTRQGFVVCGKLIHLDSNQICLKERVVTNPHCRQRDKYEITIIPNNP